MYCPQHQRLAQIPVGAGLPAKAVCQSIILQLNHRFRRQASSHISHVLPTKSAPGSAPVGAGLLAKALCQSMTLQLNHRYRRQAHTLAMYCPQNQRLAQPPVGAGLPAKAVCQSMILQLNHRFRRQASSHISHVLPTKSAPASDPLWERACPRRRCVSQ